MSLFLYNLAIGLYSALIALLARTGYQKAQQIYRGRRRTWQELPQFNPNKKPVAWFHCASLGEFEQGRPVIEAFKEKNPGFVILLTFFSPSGYEVRKSYPKADQVCYLPSDNARNAKRFIEQVNPQIAFFVKYEFWHHYLKGLHQRQTPAISFASIFRKEQLFFKPYGGFYRKTLQYFRHLFVQQEGSETLLHSIGIKHCSVAPDTRFDRVYALCQSPRAIPEAAYFARQAPTLIIGSAWQSDLEVLAGVLSTYPQPLKIILAPHEIGEANLQAMEKLMKPLPIIRFSTAQNHFENKDQALLDEAQVLLIDNIGMLSSLYQYGNWAYIGGAFGSGLHNTLEAATFGLPVVFGPKYQKFQEAIDLVEQDAGFSVKDAEGFYKVFDRLYQEQGLAKQSGQKASAYVKSNLGGTEAVLRYVQEQILQ